MALPYRAFSFITVTIISLSTLSKYFQSHVVSNQVQVFAISSQITLLLQGAIGGYAHYFPLNDQSHCNALVAFLLLFALSSKFFTASFFLSRLRYFFQSDNLSLNINIKLYYGWLCTNLLLLSSSGIYLITYSKGTLKTYPNDPDITYCDPFLDDALRFGAPLFIAEGFMHCILLYLYYTKDKQLKSMSMTGNLGLDDKYLKKQIVQRSIIFGIIGIISIWIFGIFLALEISHQEMRDCLIIFMLVIQSFCIILSFDICAGCCDINLEHGHERIMENEAENHNVSSMTTVEPTTEREEYLAKMMRVYYHKPERNNNQN